MPSKKTKRTTSTRQAAILQNKLLSLENLAKVVNQLKKQGKVVVQCHGVFDLIHPGHIFHFESAKKQGDILVVTVTQDKYVNKGPGRPVFTEDVRAKTIASLSVVDYVAINTRESGTEALLKIRPHVYAKGDEYADESKDISGGITREREAAESIGGRLYFTSEPTFSSSTLLNKYFNALPSDTKKFMGRFKKQYNISRITTDMKKMKSLKVLVIGEAIVDEYHYCFPMGKSAKESIVASKFLKEESFAGGVLACANHTSDFVKEVKILSVLGKEDSKEEFIRSCLKPNVSSKFILNKDAPTIVKRRYVWDAFLVKLFEIVFMNEAPISEYVEKKILVFLDKELPKYDLVIATDYGHGLFTKAIIDKISKQSKFLALNVQTNSANIGFNLITKYPRADYVCIDHTEMRLAHHDRFGDIRKLVKNTAKQLKAGYVAATLGHQGSIVWSAKDGFAETPVLSKEVVDRMGAGDAFLAITAPCVRAGLPPDLVGFIGNTVGALAVRTIGNRTPIESLPLMKFMTTLLK